MLGTPPLPLEAPIVAAVGPCSRFNPLCPAPSCSPTPPNPRYLEAVLNLNDEGTVIAHPDLHAALEVAAAGVAVLASLAADRRAVADAARATELARLAEIDRQEQADALWAQTFNTHVSNRAAPGQVTTLKFPKPLRFELRTHSQRRGDMTILGPGGKPWFMMQRSNPSFFGFGSIFKSCHFVITSMAGEPLLVLQESFSWMNYKYDLYRLDPNVPGAHIPVCQIQRTWSLTAFHETYTVGLHGPMAHHPAVYCTGRWPVKFTLSANGLPVSTVEKKMWTWNDKYHVELAAHQDVLLFVGIACAIDRIHAEIEREQRANRN